MCFLDCGTPASPELNLIIFYLKQLPDGKSIAINQVTKTGNKLLSKNPLWI